jgi:hypothetical protein
MKDYLNRIRHNLSHNLVSECQSLKDACLQQLQRLQATLGSFGEGLREALKQAKQNYSGSRLQGVSGKKPPIMKNVWMLHILDPRVTPHKLTFLEKLKEIFK